MLIQSIKAILKSGLQLVVLRPAISQPAISRPTIIINIS